MELTLEFVVRNYKPHLCISDQVVILSTMEKVILATLLIFSCDEL